MDEQRRTRRRESKWSAIRKALLACGLAYPVAYVVANDVVAARIYSGYSRADQAISELSATEAPSRKFLTTMLPVFTLLIVGFGFGVRKAGEWNKPLRLTGDLLIAHGLSFPAWSLFPMTSREAMAKGRMPSNDVGHLALGAASILFILSQEGFSAAALGNRFRPFSIAMGALALGSGGLTGRLSARFAEGGATSGMGILERVSYGSWLAWMAVLALTLLRGQRSSGALKRQRWTRLLA